MLLLLPIPMTDVYEFTGTVLFLLVCLFFFIGFFIIIFMASHKQCTEVYLKMETMHWTRKSPNTYVINLVTQIVLCGCSNQTEETAGPLFGMELVCNKLPRCNCPGEQLLLMLQNLFGLMAEMSSSQCVTHQVFACGNEGLVSRPRN